MAILVALALMAFIVIMLARAIAGASSGPDRTPNRSRRLHRDDGTIVPVWNDDNSGDSDGGGGD